MERDLERLKWDEYFMGIACVAANRSKHPTLQVGACIVHKDNRVLGIGYNGMPRGIEDSDRSEQGNYDAYFCDAIENAFAYMTVPVESLRGARIYTTVFPSNANVRNMIQTGIVEVICPSLNPSRGPPEQETLDMITFERIDRTQGNNSTKIYCRPFESSKKFIIIDFEDLRPLNF